MPALEIFPNAPVPTDKELKARKNVFLQFARFIALNLKMVAMMNKGHH